MDERDEVNDDIVDEGDESLLGMATIGYASRSPEDPEYIVTVERGDGEPHFCVYNGDDVRRGVEVACISYERAEYVEAHPAPAHPPFKLSREQRETLVKFFGEPFNDDPTITNWQYRNNTWERGINNENGRTDFISGTPLHLMERWSSTRFQSMPANTA